MISKSIIEKGDMSMAEMKDEEIIEETVDTPEEGQVEETAEAAEETEKKEDAPKEKKKKKEKKDKRDEQIAELNDKLIRQMAEFQNFRNRTEKEKAAQFEIGAKSIIEKLLPVMDSFERALLGKSEEEIAADAFADGMNKVYKQMLSMLEEAGLKVIEASAGTEFDPNFHNAVMQAASDSIESGHIVQELQKGYTYRDSVVRYSMVSVAE